MSALATARAPSGGRMRARAEVRTEARVGADGRSSTHLTSLRSETPLRLHETLAKEPEPWAAHSSDVARVSVTAGAAGPIGGDHLRLDVTVGAGTVLVLTEVSPTLLLPGRDGARSLTEVQIRVEGDGTLVWLPEPVIAAKGCHHLNDVRIDLDPAARLLLREELLLGRHREEPGVLRQRVRARRGGGSLYFQDLELGTAIGGTPTVAGHRRAVGSLLVVDPDWHDDRPESAPVADDAALMPLAGPGVLISCLADDSLELRRRLGTGLALLGPPWDPASTPPCSGPENGADAGRVGTASHTRVGAASGPLST